MKWYSKDQEIRNQIVLEGRYHTKNKGDYKS
jgi:hypothetical protein